MPDRTESVLEFVGAGKTRSEVVELRPPIGSIRLGRAAFDVGPSMVIADLDDGIRRMFAAFNE